MVTRIALIAAAAAIHFGIAPATFAAPKRIPQQQDQRIPEPLYFKYARGEEG